MKKFAILASVIAATFATAASADTYPGTNVHAEFEREVPVVCKLVTAGNESQEKDGSVHAGGVLLFAGEDQTEANGANFKFETNVGDGTGELTLVHNDFVAGPGYGGGNGDTDGGTTGLTGDKVKFFVDNEAIEKDGTAVISGEFVVHAQLTDTATNYTAGSTLQADAFFLATTGGSNELDCGVNNFIYKGE